MVYFYILDTKTKSSNSSIKKPTANVTKITIDKLIKNFKKKKNLKIYSKKFIDTLKSEERLFYNNKKISLYKTEMCRSFLETGYCKYENNCQFCHSPYELRTVIRHPKYKTEICKTFWLEGSCPYGKRCCFAHQMQEREIIISKNEFKTEIYKKINAPEKIKVYEDMRNAPEITEMYKDIKLSQLTLDMTGFNMAINEKEKEKETEIDHIIKDSKKIITENKSKIPMPYKLAFQNSSEQIVLYKKTEFKRVVRKDDLKICPIFADLVQTPEEMEKYEEFQSDIFRTELPEYKGKFKPIFIEDPCNSLMNMWDNKIWKDEFINCSEQWC